MTEEIKKGDEVKITLDGLTYIGKVQSVWQDQRTKMFNIELDVTGGTAFIRGYTYWKQGQDGGEVEKV